MPTPVLEEDFQPLSVAELTVWDDAHPKPPSGDAFEQSLCQWMTDDAAKQLAALAAKDEATREHYRQVVGGAWQTILGGGVPSTEDLAAQAFAPLADGNCQVVPGLVRRKSIGSENPTCTLAPHDSPSSQRYVLWIDPAGKSGLFDKDGAPRPEVRKLLDAGITVIGVDLFLQGEFLTDGKPPTELRRVANPRRFLGYTLGYNQAPFAERVRDILSVAAHVRSAQLSDNDTLDVVGVDGAGKFVAGALAVGSGLFDHAAIDDDGFRFAQIDSLWSIDVLPGAVKYGDVPGMIALAEKTKIWQANQPTPDKRRAAAVAWLLQQ